MREQHAVAQPGRRGDDVGCGFLDGVVLVALDEDLAQAEQQGDPGAVGQPANGQGCAHVLERGILVAGALGDPAADVEHHRAQHGDVGDVGLERHEPGTGGVGVGIGRGQGHGRLDLAQHPAFPGVGGAVRARRVLQVDDVTVAALAVEDSSPQAAGLDVGSE